MSNKAYFYALRTIRHFQTCDFSLIGRNFLFNNRSYSSRTKLLKGVAHYVNRLQLNIASSQTNVSIRFLSQNTPLNSKENNVNPFADDKATIVTDPEVGTDLKGKPYSDVLDPLEEVNYEPQSVPPATKQCTQYEILQALQKCTSPSDVLDLCGSSTLSMKVVSNCFTTMWETSKKIGIEHRRYESQIMFDHPNFGNLCRQAMERAPRMNSNDLVYTLHAVVKLQVSQRSRLVQTLLRVCQERLNELSEREISILASCLDGMESCRNVDALRSGLRLLVELRMSDIKGVLQLQTMIRCVGKDAPLSLKKKLENKALQMADKFTVPNAQYMFSTLAAINLRSLPLLDICSDKLIDNIDALSFWRIIHVLQACRDLNYHNEELLTSIGDHIVSTLYMWQTKQITLFLSLLEKLHFRHIALLDCFAERVIKSPESLTFKDLLISVKVYSLLNHLPKGQSQQFLDALNTSLQLYLPRIPPLELLRVVYSFCILGYFPQAPLDQLLKEEVLHELLNSVNQNVEISERMLYRVNLCLELDKLAETKSQMRTLGTSSTANLATPPEVLETLLKIVGEPDLFLQNIKLPNDYYFDFEIALDAEQKKIIPVTETCSPHVKRLAVLCCPITLFCLGTLHPLGKLAMKVRHIKALGYHVVLVPLHEFAKLNDSERIEFLSSQIFSVENTTSAQEMNTEHARHDELNLQPRN
ncbi:FAST kinase domain-containing protein 2, mitochondrial [Bombina bombina]|uniref:FAST kinase domain-containing protein 2, mitochondrial n=1 Tax=Bombina bombina TaxID=8345 RepID=UPI00235A6B06|nr:FAST kinase domain-containing protein 2, mitochondrial [Bombina bombina]XP_053554626.1 FAST kinase domain-containing protein 2, mitochondrial [Bombina bombina]